MRISQRENTSCSGKVTYATIGECERAMRKMRSKHRHGQRHRKNKPYRCASCCGFHISSMTHAEYEDRVLHRGGLRDPVFA